MLSLCELRRASRIIQGTLSGAKLRRVSQPDGLTLLLVFDTAAGKSNVLISCRPEYARICLSEPIENTASGSFYEYLQAHLTGSFLSGIEMYEDDRQTELKLQAKSDAYFLILSILGPRSNIYLLDAARKLVHSFRPIEETRRELKIGEIWINTRGTVPTQGIDRWENIPDEQYLDAIGKDYLQLERDQKAEQLKRRIEQALKKERTFLDRKVANLREDLIETRQAEVYRLKGELLKSVLHSIKPGDENAAATDYRTGETVDIPLDPTLSPAANLESYFARYQKVSRGVKFIEQQLSELEAIRSGLETVEQQLVKAFECNPSDLEGLEKIASQSNVQRLINRHFPKKNKITPAGKTAEKNAIPTRLLPKRYRTQDGLEIWVGRSDEANDYLSTRLARGNDLFFHLEGYPGSHVVLRTEGKTDPPPGSLLDACELAVHFSKMKNAGSANVHVAPIKDVKKPKGAKPGLVYVRSGKTIYLRRDPKRLEKILSSRE
jgi:predicted ribosome quality control (RQC) complex YloA/Tae2 family protein